MNAFALSGLFAFICSLTFGIFSWIKGKRFLNKIWAIFNFSVTVWGFGAFKFSTTLNQDSVFFWLRLGHIGVIFIPVLFLHFVFEFLGIRNKKVIYLTYILGLIFSILNITDWLGITKVFIVSLRYVFDSFYVDSPPGPAYSLFVAFFLGAVIYAHYHAFRYLKVSTGLRRMQIKYFLLATAIGFGGGGTAFPMVFNIDIYPTLHFTVCLYPIIMTYAILRYRLMDIKVVITRAGILALVYTLVLGIPFGIGALVKTTLPKMNSNWRLLPMFLLVVLASAGPFIYIRLKKRIETRLRPEEFKSHEALRELSHNMLRFITDLEDLLRLIVHYLIKILKLKFAAVYLFDDQTNKYILKSYWQPMQFLQTVFEPPLGFSKDLALIKDLYLRRVPIVAEELKLFAPKDFSPHIKELLTTLSDLKANTVIPSFLHNDLLGFLVLSDRRTDEVFSQGDLNLLMVLSNEIALAIENAQFHQKEKLVLAEKSRREALADMAPGASHQFNNRLVAISSSVDLLLYKLENINIDEVQDKNLKTVLEDTKEALGRIDKEVYKGKEITSAILKRAKAKINLQKIDVPNLIENAYQLVLISHSKSGVENFEESRFNIVLLNKLPLIFASEAFLHDCFYNLIDNAFDAIHEKQRLISKGELQLTKDLAYQGEIKVTLKQEDRTVVIQIKDNGIGLTREDQRRLFTPYFTTKATSDKGKGLGLYVIRDFIEMHKGSIVCDSEYGKGTTFTIKLASRKRP